MSVLNIREFPDDLHERLKILAVKRKKPLREIVIELLEASIDNADPSPA
jgi:plasmid stability protein